MSKRWVYVFALWFKISAPTNALCCALTSACPRPAPVLRDLSSEIRKKKWEIDRKELDLLQELGSGNFGKVYKGDILASL